jgi:sulfotransferase family protein
MLDDLGLPFLFTHDGSDRVCGFSEIRICKKPMFYKHPVVFLSRDPRDTVVSGYFEMSRRSYKIEILYSRAISDFARDPRYGIEKVILFNKGWLKKGARLRRFLPITYEQLTDDPEAVLRTVADFVGAEVSDDAIARVVRENTFERMHQREANGEYGRYGTKLTPRDQADPESYKMRRGKRGGYVDYLSPDDLAYCNAMLERYRYWRPNSLLVKRLQIAKLSIQKILRL